MLGNASEVIFVNNLGFSHIVPMRSNSQVGNALTEFSTIRELLQSCTCMLLRNSHKDSGRRFYLNMEGSSRLLLNLTVLGRIKQKLGFENIRNKSLEC